MPVADWIFIAAFGVIFGTAGQLIRVALGLRKLNQGAGLPNSSEFNTNRLVLSLLYGALAGIAALVIIASGFGSDTLQAFDADTIVEPSQVLTVMAAGYAGADAIEGFVKTHLQRIDLSNFGNRHGAADQQDTPGK